MTRLSDRHRNPFVPRRDPEEKLAELRRRIAATRCPQGTRRQIVAGVQLATLQELARYLDD